MRNVYIIVFVLIASTCFAATYHIDPDAANGGDGSHTSPYNEWSDLPSMSTGDDVYFKCDTTYQPSSNLSITWQGTSGDRAVIGAYYLSGGSPVYGISGQRPKIDGQWTVPTNQCMSSGTEPDSWSGMIDVRDKDYVTVENLNIYKSGYTGILFQGARGTTAQNVGLLINNNIVEQSVMGGISVNRSALNYGTISNNVLRLNNIGHGWLEVPDTSTPCRTAYYPNWPATLTVVNCPNSNTTVSGNQLYNNWGEGISIANPCDHPTECVNAGHATVEDNIIFNNARGSLYINRTESNIVRRNIIAAENDCLQNAGGELCQAITTAGGRNWSQIGIWLNAEVGTGTNEPTKTINNQIYNNLIIGYFTGFGWGNAQSATTMTGNKVYNNTIIDNYQNLWIGSNLSDDTTTGSEYRNNLHLCTPGSVCNNVSGNAVWFDTKITGTNSAWTTSYPLYVSDIGVDPTDTLVDENDIVSGIDWQNLTEGDIPNIENLAKLVLGSNLINAGSTDSDGPDDDFWEKARPVDGVDDIGIHEFGAPTQNSSPIISAFTPESQCIAESNNVSLTHTSSDPDSDALSYSWEDNGVEIYTTEDPGNYGATQWSNGETHVIELTVDDGRGGTATRSATINVSASCGTTYNETKTVGQNSTDDYGGTIDCWIKADDETGNNNNSNLRIEDPTTNDTDQKVTLLGFDLTSFTGLTITSAKVYVYVEDNGLESTNDINVKLYDADNDFTEAATWNTYNGTNSWAASDSPEGTTELGSEAFNTGNTGWITFDSADDADLLTQVQTDRGDFTRFALFSDTTTTEFLRFISSEGADTYRPYIEITYTVGASVDISSCEWVTSDGTYGEGDSLSLICTWDSNVTLSNGDKLTIGTNATGATVEFVATGDGNASRSLTFVETIPASATTSGAELTLTDGAGDDLTLSGGTFTGNKELPGSPYRVEDSGSIYIDTTADTWTSSCVVAAGGTACVTKDHVFTRGQKPRFKLTAGTAITLSGGSANDVTLTVDIDAGDDLVFRPVSGIGTTSWIFEAQAVKSDMKDAALAADAVGDLTHAGITLEDLSGNDMTNTDLPQTALDPTYTCKVDGSARTWTNRSAGGSVTTVR
jgi:hypothetical protein